MSDQTFLEPPAARSTDSLPVRTASPDLIDQAIDCSILNRISFWDALILSCAIAAHCDVLWTEDLSAGRTIAGVRIENPLA